MRGKFITLEGPEGAGKTSACKMVTEIFPNRRITIVREPGSTSFGEKIRSILQTENMPARSELMLFEAARACIVDTVIIPLLEEGVDILCDRFYDSTTSYQGFGRGMSLEFLQKVNGFATGGLMPDCTFIFDVPSEVSCRRMEMMGKKRDRLEQNGSDFFDRIRKGYRILAEKDPEGCLLIDGSREIGEISEIVYKKINKFLKSALLK